MEGFKSLTGLYSGFHDPNPLVSNKGHKDEDMWNMPGAVDCEKMENEEFVFPGAINCEENEAREDLKTALEQLSNEDIDMNLDFIFE